MVPPGPSSPYPALTPPSPPPSASRCTPYTANVAADISVIVLTVVCAASAGCFALIVLRLWRAGSRP